MKPSQQGFGTYVFITLILVVIVAGASQGLLLPLLSIWLEQRGISAQMNALNSAALYIGIFATMFFIERPVRRYGFHPVILTGIILVIAASILFPFTDNLVIWFVLRLVVGVGDSALHYAAQLWIVSNSPAERRGRNISLYGMAYGIGFSIGPLAIGLAHYGNAVPIVIMNILFVIVLLMVLRMRNERPPGTDEPRTNVPQENRFLRVYRLAWFPLIPAFLYGYMEASMNGNFPIYGLRLGLDSLEIGYLLPLIGAGSLILQLPLGIWSDKIGRKPILMLCGIVGASAFLAVPLAGTNVWIIGALFLLAGGAIGSFYSLGLAYAADLLPRSILPTANVIASIHFSLASLIGPNAGGWLLQHVSLSSLFYAMGSVYILFAFAGFRFRRSSSEAQETSPT
ncbi:MFS transporter [Paenibacillus sambharensis]|uniref:MFS transporter n=1 Tax=Paenibacillus sambharensis TaxID=1803190 RepID=A0A2W1LR34_9BACL|nr:MFS transporter [Paenibacillus sambharensis]PZD97422.1 MFS transporter [Paenibacillus sambharensis]